MSRINWLIDAGHGGVDSNGNYTTDPIKNKRYKFDDGLEILEGVVNRKIAEVVYKSLTSLGISFALVYNDVEDVSLAERVRRINKLATKSRCCLLSIHSNAGKGKGFEFFTSPGQTASDLFCDVIIDTYVESFPEFALRSDTKDGDYDKEEKFTILTASTCPAILIENLFFDNREEAEFLLSVEGQKRIGETIVKAIQEIELNTKL